MNDMLVGCYPISNIHYAHEICLYALLLHQGRDPRDLPWNKHRIHGIALDGANRGKTLDIDAEVREWLQHQTLQPRTGLEFRKHYNIRGVKVLDPEMVHLKESVFRPIYPKS